MNVNNPENHRIRLGTLLASALVLALLVAGAVFIVPKVGQNGLTAEPGGPLTAGPTGGPTTTRASGTPSGQASDTPSTKASTKPATKPSTKPATKPSNTTSTKPPTKASTTAPAKPSKSPSAVGKDGVRPYDGKGKVRGVSSGRGQMDKNLAERVIGTYVQAVPKITPEDEQANQLVSDIAGSAVQQELQAQLAELRSNGWTMSGSPVVKSASIVKSDLKATPPTVTVKACIDSSGVVTLDSDGKRVGSGKTPPPAANLYELRQQADGSWLLVSHTFPNNPAC